MAWSRSARWVVRTAGGRRSVWWVSRCRRPRARCCSSGAPTPHVDLDRVVRRLPLPGAGGTRVSVDEGGCRDRLQREVVVALHDVGAVAIGSSVWGRNPLDPPAASVGLPGRGRAGTGHSRFWGMPACRLRVRQAHDPIWEQSRGRREEPDVRTFDIAVTGSGPGVHSRLDVPGRCGHPGLGSARSPGRWVAIRPRSRASCVATPRAGAGCSRTVRELHSGRRNWPRVVPRPPSLLPSNAFESHWPIFMAPPPLRSPRRVESCSVVQLLELIGDQLGRLAAKAASEADGPAAEMAGRQRREPDTASQPEGRQVNHAAIPSPGVSAGAMSGSRPVEPAPSHGPSSLPAWTRSRLAKARGRVSPVRNRVRR